MVLQNAGSERRTQGFSVRLDGAHNFSAANDFGRGKSGYFRGKHKIDFQLNGGLQYFVRLKEHS